MDKPSEGEQSTSQTKKATSRGQPCANLQVAKMQKKGLYEHYYKCGADGAIL